MSADFEPRWLLKRPFANYRRQKPSTKRSHGPGESKIMTLDYGKTENKRTEIVKTRVHKIPQNLPVAIRNAQSG